MTFSKKHLIDKIYNSNPKLTKAQAKEALETILSTIRSSLEGGEDIMLSGFGKFVVKQKAARKGRNPKTGGELIIEARKVVAFKPSTKLREKIN